MSHIFGLNGGRRIGAAASGDNQREQEQSGKTHRFDPSNDKQQQLDDVAGQLRDTGYNVTVSIRSGQPETVICEEIRNSDIDLLLMGAYGHSRIRNLIIGSTTTEMIRSCKIPVMLFR